MSDEKVTDQVVATVSSLEDADVLRHRLMNCAERVWVLVYRRKDSFDVAVQNIWGNQVAQDVLERCIEVANTSISERSVGSSSDPEQQLVSQTQSDESIDLLEEIEVADDWIVSSPDVDDERTIT